MRWTLIKFNPTSKLLRLSYQTANHNGSGWVKHEHAGEYDPPPAFTAALAALDEVCAFVHEEPVVSEHPIFARGVNFSYQERSQVVFAMITGVRTISSTPGMWSLPGVKKVMNRGEDQDDSPLILPLGYTERVEQLKRQASLILPSFLTRLSSSELTLFGDDAPAGGGAGELLGFDERAREAAEAWHKALSEKQRTALVAASEQPHPRLSLFQRSGRFFKHVQELLDGKVVIIIDEQYLAPSELGLDVLELLAK